MFGAFSAGHLPSVLLRMLGAARRDHDTALLVDVLRRENRVEGRNVLDVCAGTGVSAIAAARAGALSVTAVDVSARAAAAAWWNARLNRAAVTVRRGDLFEPVRGSRFDVVVANPPAVPTAGGDEREQRPHVAGPDGRRLLDRLIEGLPDVLAFGGRALILQSGACGLRATIEAMAAQDMVADVVACATVPFGSVMRARAARLEQLGLIGTDQVEENFFVVEGRRVHGRARRRSRVDVTDEGPVLIRGSVDVMAPDGSIRRSDRAVTALCTCGRSRLLPFCDTSHRSRTEPPRVEERE